jgi:hypothetical protein
VENLPIREAAKSLGLTMPTSIVTHAADMIEQASLLQDVLVVIGPSRHFAALQRFGRFRGIADIR